MITLKKANKIVRVTENELDKYLFKGYTPIETTQVQQAEPVAPIVEEKVVEPEVVEVKKPKTTKRSKR